MGFGQVKVPPRGVLGALQISMERVVVEGRIATLSLLLVLGFVARVTNFSTTYMHELEQIIHWDQRGKDVFFSWPLIRIWWSPVSISLCCFRSHFRFLVHPNAPLRDTVQSVYKDSNICMWEMNCF